jgi:hypothetical protein
MDEEDDSGAWAYEQDLEQHYNYMELKPKKFALLLEEPEDGQV